MAIETKTWLFLSLVLLVTSNMQQCVYGEPQIPCLFIFCDSLSDNGNNNNLATTAKVNFDPYGIDFPTGPTGRFSNGLTYIDIVAQLLGFEDFIPSFANSVRSDITKGVNYASGSAGIRNETGKHLGANIDLGLQLNNHKLIMGRIALKLKGVKQATEYLNKCLYYVNIGSNDYINNYFVPKLYSTSRDYNPEQYAQVLVDQLAQSIQDLHDVGARKFVLVGTGEVGCTPNAIANHGSCNKEMNDASSIFGGKVRSLVDQLNTKFPDSKFVFKNGTGDKFDSSNGFKVVDASCCKLIADAACIRNQNPCENRNEYVFWDGFHPTMAANQVIALNSYNSSDPNIMYPTNIQKLVQS